MSEQALLSLVTELSALNDENLAQRVISDSDVQWCLSELTDILEAMGGMNADRLRELAEADKDGRVVVLPCKVGDTVYQLRQKTHAKGAGVSPRTVSCACVWEDGKYALEHQGVRDCQSKDLGKTWFLTREEAEKALEAMENA